MERIGIYGGTFNPPHAGHIQAAKQAVTALNLDALVIIPTSIAPHKAIPEDSPTPRQRLEMLLGHAQFIAPHGDMMIAGCHGLLHGLALREA